MLGLVITRAVGIARAVPVRPRLSVESSESSESCLSALCSSPHVSFEVFVMSLEPVDSGAREQTRFAFTRTLVPSAT